MQLLSATLLIFAILAPAKPLHGHSLAEIERRWSAGETEVSTDTTTSNPSTTTSDRDEEQETSLHCRPDAPGCYLYAWFHSLASLYSTSNDVRTSAAHNHLSLIDGTVADDYGVLLMQASIHSGLTHRDATPAWPIQRSSSDDDDDRIPGHGNDAFAYATDERSMMRAQRQRRAENTPSLQKLKNFVSDFYRQRGEKGVIARDAQLVRSLDEDSAPVLKPRRGMKYSFTAQA